MDIKKLQPHEERVIFERHELEIKYKALDDFMGTETFNSLDPEDINLLYSQKKHMKNYIGVLNVRIGKFIKMG